MTLLPRLTPDIIGRGHRVPFYMNGSGRGTWMNEEFQVRSEKAAKTGDSGCPCGTWERLKLKWCPENETVMCPGTKFCFQMFLEKNILKAQN